MSADAKIKPSSTGAGVLLLRAYTIVLDMLYESFSKSPGKTRAGELLLSQAYFIQCFAYELLAPQRHRITL